MRIGILTYDYAPSIGGMGVVAKQYVDRLRQLFPEHAFVVISPGSSADDRVNALARMRFRRSGGCPLFSIVLAFRLSGIIRRHRLDVLHVHAGSGGVFLIRKPSCPVVVTAHHTYRQEADLVFRNRPLKRWGKILMSLLERRTYRLADRVTCVSADTSVALIREYGIEAGKITVIENPVPTPTLITAGEGIHRRNPLVILSAGRLEERKGTRTLLEAFSIVLRSVPAARLRLVGTNLMGAALVDLIRTFNIGSSVDLVGQVPQEQLEAERRTAGMVVVPSVLEGFGLAAAEAMTEGCPLIVSDAPGLKSLVVDGTTGLVFRSGDAADCARCMERMLADPAGASSLGRAAMKEAATRFALDARTRDLEKLIRGTSSELRG